MPTRLIVRRVQFTGRPLRRSVGRTAPYLVFALELPQTLHQRGIASQCSVFLAIDLDCTEPCPSVITGRQVSGSAHSGVAKRVHLTLIGFSKGVGQGCTLTETRPRRVWLALRVVDVTRQSNQQIGHVFGQLLALGYLALAAGLELLDVMAARAQ